MTKYTPVGDIVSGSRKDVTVEKTGHIFEIRQIQAIDFLGEGLLPIGDLATAGGRTEGEIMDAIDKSLKGASEDKIVKFYKVLLCKGITSHNVISDGPSDPDTGTIYYADLCAEDTEKLIEEMVAFSGASLAMWGVNAKGF